MCMVHDIFHSVFEINESGFCSVIHVSTEIHGKVLNIVAGLNSGVYEATNPLIEVSSVWVFNFSDLLQ